MKTRKKILRIRPFNMANFSSGAGYMLFYAIMGAIFVIPLSFFIWWTALSLKTGEGDIEYKVFKRTANWIFLPVMVVLSVIGLFITMPDIFSYFGTRDPAGSMQWAALIWIVSFPTIGMYFVVRIVAAVLESRGKFTNELLLIWVFVLGFFHGIISLIVTAILAEGSGVGMFIIIAVAALALTIFLQVTISNKRMR